MSPVRRITPLARNETSGRPCEIGDLLVAVEWEREVESTEEQLPADVPFGLQIVPETRRLETNPAEREILFQMMELVVEEGSYARIADEINRCGFRTRQGHKWSPVSVFEMIPRLIEVGPHVFRSQEWQKRKDQAAGPSQRSTKGR